MKQVAIWAPLRYCNYGDDLQAIVFAKYIKSLGYYVKLFQLDDDLAKIYDFRVARTVDELCKDVKLCIIAGGALLTPFLLPKRILNKSALEYEKDFKDLYKATKKYGIKFCAISMGGDGNTRNPFFYYSRSRINFFKSSNFLNGTDRLEGDVLQMRKFGKEFQYIPDCLFQCNKILKINNLETITGNRNKKRIALNFKKGKYLSEKLLHDIYNYSHSHNDIEFIFTTTHMEKTGINYEYVPETLSDNIKVYKYTSPEDMLKFIAGIDLFITSKLHLGLTGLTVGTPFLSYRGPEKAKTFLDSIGGGWAVIDNNIKFSDLEKIFFRKTKNELFSKYNLEILNEMINSSFQQYLFCKKIIEAYG